MQTGLKEELLGRLRVLENSLAHDMSQGRERINKLRMEAAARNKRFDVLVAGLNKVKAEMVGLLERSNAALAAKNDAAEQLKAEREADESARAAYEAEALKLQTAIAQSHASTVAAARASAMKKPGDEEGEEDGPGSGNLTEEQEEAARSTILRLDQLITEHEAICADLHRQTQQLQDVFRAMIGQAGLHTLDELVDKFAEAEAFKYEIYGYVTHTSAETASYEEMLRDTRDAQANYVAELAAAARTQRQQLDGMKAELASLQRQAEAVTQQKSSVYAVARRVVLELLRVYAAVGGDDTSRLSLLPSAGSHAGSGAVHNGQPDQQGGEGDEASGALVVSKEEITSILGDIEQATSDLTIALGNALKDRSARGLLADGVDAWEGLVHREKQATVNSGQCPAEMQAALDRNLRLVRHLHQAVSGLHGSAVEELRASLHKQPATPARVVVPASANRTKGAPTASAVSALSMRQVEPSSPSHHPRHVQSGVTHNDSQSHARPQRAVTAMGSERAAGGGVAAVATLHAQRGGTARTSSAGSIGSPNMRALSSHPQLPQNSGHIGEEASLSSPLAHVAGRDGATTPGRRVVQKGAGPSMTRL